LAPSCPIPESDVGCLDELQKTGSLQLATNHAAASEAGTHPSTLPTEVTIQHPRPYPTYPHPPHKEHFKICTGARVRPGFDMPSDGADISFLVARRTDMRSKSCPFVKEHLKCSGCNASARLASQPPPWRTDHVEWLLTCERLARCQNKKAAASTCDNTGTKACICTNRSPSVMKAESLQGNRPIIPSLKVEPDAGFTPMSRCRDPHIPFFLRNRWSRCFPVLQATCV
jgi:hypothetical protein